jgi:parvulin-like peptidyl-prolyl isomerase
VLRYKAVVTGSPVWVVAAALVLGGCPRKAEEPKPAAREETAIEPDDPAVADIPFDEKVPDDPARLPKAPGRRPLEVAARYILINHAGTTKPVSSRSKDDADKRARRLTRAARKQGADFEELARRFSEAPKAVRGVTELFREGESTDPAFLKAVTSMAEGQVADPVHTDFGFYVIQRVVLEEYSTAHILVVYQGAKLAPPGLKRTVEEAREKAEKVAAKAHKPENSFALLASRYSDSPSKLRGGVIAPIRPDSLLEGFEPYLEAVKQLKVNEVSQVVETPYGFHVIKRLPLQKILVRHILLAYTGAVTEPKEPRTKAEARALAAKLRAGARAPDADFAALAQKYSDGPSAGRGGLLKPFARGVMAPRFEQYAFALRPGAISDVVNTKFGFHVIKRVR